MFGLYWYSPPARTWSRAREPPLRSQWAAMGLPGVSNFAQVSAIIRDNGRAQIWARIIRTAWGHGLPAYIEAGAGSWLWHTRLFRRLRDRPVAKIYTIDMCRFSSCWLKPTSILHNTSFIDTSTRCSGGHSHLQLWGRAAHLAAASHWAPALADLWACHLCSEAGWAKWTCDPEWFSANSVPYWPGHAPKGPVCSTRSSSSENWTGDSGDKGPLREGDPDF